jgi:hypothetical protein
MGVLPHLSIPGIPFVDGVSGPPGAAGTFGGIVKLTTTTMVTVDGAMQGLGGADEDRTGGFERGGWVAPLWDHEGGTFLNQVYARADAFLFGRRTYEIFAGSWGTWADPGDNPIWTALNPRPQVRGLDHRDRPAVGRHDRPLR